MIKLFYLLAINLALQGALVLGGESIALNALLSDKDARPGLVVHLDCGDGSQTMALAGNPKARVIQGLTLKGEIVEKIRAQLLEQKLFGRVSVDRLAAATLPYADNMVNALVAKCQQLRAAFRTATAGRLGLL